MITQGQSKPALVAVAHPHEGMLFVDFNLRQVELLDTHFAIWARRGRARSTLGRSEARQRGLRDQTTGPATAKRIKTGLSCGRYVPLQLRSLCAPGDARRA
jgi:hypothetical protein